MGPAFNPGYWCYGLIFLIGAASVATASFYLAKASRVNSAIAFVIALTVFLLIFCNLCQWSLSGPPLPQMKPAKEDIVGLWEMGSYSIQKVQPKEDARVLAHTLEFNEDSTFVMTNMPSWWLSSGAHSATRPFDSGSGMWNIAEDRNGDWYIRVYIGVLNGQGVNLDGQFYLLGHQSPYTVFIWELGDPDNGIITFERELAP